MKQTQARSDAQDATRDRMKNQLVPKDLRNRAMIAANSITDAERRTHARNFVLFKGRKVSELESFLKRMSR